MSLVREIQDETLDWRLRDCDLHEPLLESVLGISAPAT
jgi:hypothetical protein